MGIVTVPLPPSSIIQEEVVLASPPEDARIGNALYTLFRTLPSAASARRALRRDLVYRNGEVANWRDGVYVGDHLVLLERPPREGLAVFVEELNVVYEDEHLAVVDKPAGLLVNGLRRRTLEACLPHVLCATTEPDALSWPRPVHRLDGRTSGLVAVAKTASALAGLSRQFQERGVQKRYLAIVAGRLDGEGDVREPVGGRESWSSWRAVEHTRSLRTQWMTTVELTPHTGRTHQLRLHMAHLGHPILGDGRYGDSLRGRGLFLQAVELHFTHPIRVEPVTACVPELPRFQTHRAREHRRWDRHYDPDGFPRGS